MVVPSSLPVRHSDHHLLGGLLQVGDQVRPVLLLPQPGEDHLGAGDELAGLLQVLVQRLSAPRDALVLVRLHGKADDDDKDGKANDGGEDGDEGGDDEDGAWV